MLAGAFRPTSPRIAYQNNARCAQGHHEDAGVALEAVRAARACLKS